MRRGNRKAAGFTLLEVIVTLAVLSISLTVLLRIFSFVSLTTRVTSDYYQALKIAETRMNLLAARASLSTSESGTIDDYYHWASKVENYSLSSDSPLGKAQFETASENSRKPYLLTVSVSWGSSNQRELELTTIRLGVQ